TPRVTGGGAM
nr:Chain C, TPR peptide from CMV [Cytomegalovirus]